MSDEPLGGNLPAIELDNPGRLEAFFGAFSFFDHWRKSVLGQCRELVRAEYAIKGEKITEARTDDLARNHPLYLDYLLVNFVGREKMEQNRYDSLRNGS